MVSSRTLAHALEITVSASMIFKVTCAAWGSCMFGNGTCESFDGFEARVALQTRQHLKGVVMLSDGNEEPGDAIDRPELGQGVL
jgi:hypothetical protein